MWNNSDNNLIEFFHAQFT